MNDTEMILEFPYLKMASTSAFGLPNPELPKPGLPKPGLPTPELPKPGLPLPEVQTWNLGVQTSESKKETPLKETEI